MTAYRGTRRIGLGDERGSIIIMAAVAIVALFAFAVLTIDGAMLMTTKNQLQAVQMSFFFFLPSLLLSGFMFPFRGMPRWAQTLGEVFPLTHFLRIVRGILLKGNGASEVVHELWPIALFATIAIVVGVGRYQKTLD